MDTPTQERGKKWIHPLRRGAGSGYTHSGAGQEVDTPTQERGKKWIHPLRRGAGSGYTHSGEWQEVDTPISGCVVQRSTHTHSGEGMNWPAHAREGHEVDTPM